MRFGFFKKIFDPDKEREKLVDQIEGLAAHHKVEADYAAATGGLTTSGGSGDDKVRVFEVRDKTNPEQRSYLESAQLHEAKRASLRQLMKLLYAPNTTTADTLDTLRTAKVEVKKTEAFAVSTFGKSDTEKLWEAAISLFKKVENENSSKHGVNQALQAAEKQKVALLGKIKTLQASHSSDAVKANEEMKTKIIGFRGKQLVDSADHFPVMMHSAKRESINKLKELLDKPGTTAIDLEAEKEKQSKGAFFSYIGKSSTEKSWDEAIAVLKKIEVAKDAEPSAPTPR